MPKLTATQVTAARLAIRIAVPVVIVAATTVVANILDKKLAKEN